ncbi:MAG: hypothetical protein DRJ08_02410 [Acidobacteria bacterium]|nr:MAG: hypothetical protein DRJ08_02410 [Acidobacteriota bacterium]
MKRVSVFVLFFLMGWASAVYGQQPGGNLRLFLEPGIQELPGDGDTTTTITITLRNNEGELVNKSGTVQLKLNAGRLIPARVNLKNGIGQATFTAPILDNESKVFQRSIRLTMAIIQRLKGKSVSELTGKHAYEMNMKTARDVAMGMASVSGMTSIQGKTPTVHIIGEMNGLRGKCAIRILKVRGNVTANLRSGIYAGRDVTGSSRWKLTVRRGGPGYIGTIKTGGAEISFRSKGEKKGGFLIVYLFDERDMQATKNSAFLGWPTAMKVLPGNTLYMVAPPVYLTRKGDIPKEGYETEEKLEETEKVSLIIKQNILPGDGKSETQMVFIYRDKKGRPKSGIPVRLQIGRSGMGGTLIQAKGRTDSRGIFRCRYRAPVFKTNNFQKLGTCKQDIIWAYYQNGKKEKYITSTVGIVRCTEARLILDKPGFEDKKGLPVTIASPRGRITGTILARVKRPYGMYDVSDVPIGYAKVWITGGAITGHESMFEAETDKNGKLNIELKYRNWPAFYSHKLKKPFIYPFSEVHKKRRDSLGKNLYMFPDKAFQKRAGQQVYTMELAVVMDPPEQAEAYEAKFQLLGDLMATYWMSEKLVADTTGEVIRHGWSLLGMAWDWANKKFKFGRKVKGMAREGSAADLVFKGDEAGSKSIKRMIFQRFNAIITRNQKSKWGRAAVVAMNNANAKIFNGLKQFLGFLADYVSKENGIKWPKNPVPDQIKQEVLFYYRGITMKHLDNFLVANPQAVLDAFDDVQPWLVSNSGNLRDHYQNIARRRLVVEEAKAWKDLSVDLTQGFAIGLAVGTGQVWALKWWEKFKKFSDMLDKAYAGSAFLGELYTCSSLMTECGELFIHTNRAIGAVDDPLVRERHLILPVAYAGESANGKHSAPPAIFPMDADELKLLNDRIPTASVRCLMDSYCRFLVWEEKADYIWMLAMDRSEVKNFVEARQVYSDAMETLAVIAVVAANGTMEKDLQDRWEDLVEQLKKQGKRVDKYASRAYQQGLQRQTSMMEDDRRVGTYARRKPGKPLTGGDSQGIAWQIIVIPGAGLVLVVIIVIGGIKWKYRTKRASRLTTASHVIENISTSAVPRLVIPGGENIPLKGGVMEIGAESDNDIVLPYIGVLAYHATVCIGDTGNWWIESPDGSDSIQVNGVMGQSFWLTHGSRIRLGSAELIFLDS